MLNDKHIAIVYPKLTICIAIVTDLVLFSLIPRPEEEEEKDLASAICTCAYLALN